MSSNNKTYKVPVDPHGNWIENRGGVYILDEETLDKIISKYEGEIYRLIEGRKGVMAMWACFLNHLSIRGTCSYSSAINAYCIMSDDHKSLVDREHELRHKWNQYEILWKIRYHGSLTQYYEDKLKEKREWEEHICSKVLGGVVDDSNQESK